MFAKLKRGLHRLKHFLTKPFRGRGRGRTRDPVQSMRLDPMDWDGLRSLTTSLDQTTGIPRLLVTTVAKLSECIEAFDDEALAHSEYGSLQADLNDLLRELSSYLDGVVLSSAGRSRVDNLARCLDDMVRPLRLKRGEGEPGREDEIKEGIDETLRGYGRIRGVIARFVLSEKTKWGHSNEVNYNDALSHLPQSTSAQYDSSDSYSTGRNGCTPNTCVGVLQQLQTWASYNPHQKLYWLNGSPGTGKTTIAYSFCEELKDAGKLAASFFCARWSPECRDANTILPSISYQLAVFSRPFQCAISNTFDQGVDLQVLSIQDQFERLIATPLKTVGHTFSTGVVVVIDALDECENAEHIDQIIDVLLAVASNLPVKFLVTSRVHPNITYRMRSKPGGDAFFEWSLSALNPLMVRADIKTFLEAELHSMRPSAEDLEHLTNLSATSVHRASVLVRYVLRGYQFGSAERARRMRQLLNAYIVPSDTNDEGMDSVYDAMLEAALEANTFGGPERAETERLIHTVICAHEPLSVEALAGLLSLGRIRLECFLLEASKLVLQVSEVGRLVTTRHKSFSGYLVDQRRSDKYYCDSERYNISLAQTCFDLIRAPVSELPDQELNIGPQRDKSTSQANLILNVASPHCLYACRYWSVHAQLVDRSEPTAAFEKLRQVLEASNPSDVDMFYTTLLEWALRNAAAENTTDRMAKVLGTVTCAQEDLTLSDIKDWAAIDSADLMNLLAPLLFLSDDGKVVVVHSSFSSYISDTARSGAFYCDLAQYHTRFAQTCYDLIKLPDPPFNICSLPSSYLLDEDVPDIQETVRKTIPPKLLYACKYWGNHIRLASRPSALLEAAHEIVASRLLLCIEVLNLCGVNSVGVEMLHRLHEYLQAAECEDDTRRLVHDARQFLKQFSESSASQSTPHVYVSMLALWPNDQSISRHYLPRMRGLIQVEESEARLPYSHDDECLVSSSDNRSEPGRLGLVYSVTYSPDGAYIASGSIDKTVRIWDARNGRLVGQPLKGHKAGAASVAYSPDGSHIASGSYDKTIRIWDAKTGQAMGRPLEGHTGSAYSVAYSPDGAYIASGSDDHTVRIWDAHSGQPIGQPLKGHTYPVYSVAYSPDGAHIASGSMDKTVRIWDAKTGQAAGQPLQGHTSYVHSAAYSPDGAYIVSGSSDQTIRIWDAKTGRSVGQPLTGHTGVVLTVAYSPNGEYIASGSWDKTIRIWDASTGQPVGRPLKGHTDAVRSVSFSPDGRQLASGSTDGTIRVWDVFGIIHAGLLAERELAVTQLVSGPLDSGLGNPQGMQHEIRSAVSPTPDEYELNDDGWLIGPGGERIVWAPGNLVVDPRNLFVIPSQGRSYELDLRGAKLGENWQECFNSEKQDEDFGT
ncbi:hypothetical protein FRC12_014833 [Ceratobasidium sp. 428]|nr:hypothetical protein FRC12_014833 [Ceratobasidium sp. 428]